ncbi:MAG: HD domain-containing protein, partial [Gaiellales bacterium]
MAVIETQERHEHLVEELIADVAAYKVDVDEDLLRRAFAFAERAHEGQRRRSGEDFIRHPWGAAKILATLHLDEQTLAAALLHDVDEDTGCDISDVKSQFGDEIARLVEG